MWKNEPLMHLKVKSDTKKKTYNGKTNILIARSEFKNLKENKDIA